MITPDRRGRASASLPSVVSIAIAHSCVCSQPRAKLLSSDGLLAANAEKNSPLRRLELEPRKNCHRVREGPRHGSLGSSEPCYINLAARWKSNDWSARSRYLYRVGPHGG